MRFCVALICLLAPAVFHAKGANDVPPKPAQYFNDYAHAVNAGDAERMNQELADFERQTSNQIVVAVYPKLQTDDALGSYCYRIFQAWGVGQKKLNNGAVLFVFVQDHKMWIQTGYGLEGALPDITCQSIIHNQMAPLFRQGNYTAGLQAGIDAMIAATKGEYKGNGRTVGDQHANEQNNEINMIVFAIFLLFFIIPLIRRTRGVVYGSSGVGRYGGWFIGGGGGGGGGWSGGGGGGGFSGGGGSSGGGGAGGSW